MSEIFIKHSGTAQARSSRVRVSVSVYKTTISPPLAQHASAGGTLVDAAPASAAAEVITGTRATQGGQSKQAMRVVVPNDASMCFGVEKQQVCLQRKYRSSLDMSSRRT